MVQFENCSVFFEFLQVSLFKEKFKGVQKGANGYFGAKDPGLSDPAIYPADYWAE